MNYFKELWTRIKIQWIEWRSYQNSVFNVKRDMKQINRAIERARLKNSYDGRTYYILRNLGGGFDEVNSQQLKIAKKIKYFPKYRDYDQMLSQCFAIVTSNNIQRKSYVAAVSNILKDEQTKLSE
jgi:hypothetical protein